MSVSVHAGTANRREPTVNEATTHRPALQGASGYQVVVEHLLREIALGNVLPGEKFPPERELASQLGVARTTLRQALRVLEGSGQVEVRRGVSGGAFVLPSAVSQQQALALLRARRDEMMHNFEFRIIVEAAAASLAAKRRTRGHLETMRAMQEDILRAKNIDEARRADTAFHAAIADATENPAIMRSVEDTRVIMFRATDVTAFDFQTTSTYEGHERLVEAIEQQDPGAAAQAMTDHIETTRREFLQLLDGSGFST